MNTLYVTLIFTPLLIILMRSYSIRSAKKMLKNEREIKRTIKSIEDNVETLRLQAILLKEINDELTFDKQIKE